MTRSDWHRVHEFHERAQAEAKERVLCRQGIAQRIRAAAKRTQTGTPALARLDDVEAYVRKLGTES